jgi:hypothetical protein
MKYADNLMLLSEEEAVLQCMNVILNDTEICYGMEKNVEKTKVMATVHSRECDKYNTT